MAPFFRQPHLCLEGLQLLLFHHDLVVLELQPVQMVLEDLSSLGLPAMNEAK